MTLYRKLPITFLWLACCLTVLSAQNRAEEVQSLEGIKRLILDSRSDLLSTATNAWQRLHKLRGFIQQQADLNSAEAWFYIGYLEQHSTNRIAGEEAFKRAIELKPDFAEAYHGLALHYSRVPVGCALSPSIVDKEAYKKAIPLHQKAIQLKPHFVDAYIGLADCYGVLRSYGDAVLTYEIALSLAPEDYRIYEPLAECYLQLGQPMEAIRILGLLKDHIPGYLAEEGRNGKDDLRPIYLNSAMGKLGETLFSFSRYADALEVYQLIIMMSGNDFILTYKMGLIYIRVGDMESAKQQYSILIKLAEKWAGKELFHKKIKSLADQLLVNIQK
jgi:tetratricopeptide (TPR) repeat protein